MKNRTSNHQCAGEKIREQRIRMSMTQEKLAAMSNTNARTIQRAESGATVKIETIADIAAALNFTVADITRTVIQDSAGNETDEFNAVVLRPITSGKVLLDMFLDSFQVKLRCDAEPTKQNIDTLSKVVADLERMVPDMWANPGELEKLSLANRLRSSVQLSEQLVSLNKLGIAVYAGAYTASALVPRYDGDEGHMYISGRQKAEPVTVCRVMVAPANLGTIVEEVVDKWADQNSKLGGPDDFDKEVPF